MSTSAKVIILVVVLAIIAAGVYYFSAAPASAPSSEEGAAMATSSEPAAPANGSSNGDLEQDTAALDAQINSFSSDDANISSGMSDQQVQQSSL